MYLPALNPNNMNSKKFLIGTLVGGIAFFFLGYLIYGLALANFFSQHTVAASTSMKPMSEIIWWALILGNLAAGALLTYVFLKLGNINSFSSGAGTAAVIGFFFALSMDLIRFATENTFDLTAMMTDVVVGTVMYAIAGGFIALVLGKGVKQL
jgi:arginine exporter protein ArgO